MKICLDTKLDTTTISWIFLAIGIASENSSIDNKSISQIAGGIKHAVPIEKKCKLR